MNSKIIVCAHKKDFTLSNELYMPLQVGKACSNIDLEIQGDNIGDNISIKNPNYCELTGLYWAWKNLKDIDYIGLAHYRRYFNWKNNNISYTPTQFLSSGNPEVNPIDYLGNYDIILPKPHSLINSIADTYIHAHIIEDFYILNRVILKLYPEYQETIIKFFYQSNKWYGFNMFFCNKTIFDKYCKWLFSILFEVEKYTRISPYCYQKRVFGFMGEILLPLFCFHNNLKIKFIPVCMIQEDFSYNNTSAKIKLLDIRNDIYFSLLKPKRKNINCYGKNCHIDGCFKQDNINI